MKDSKIFIIIILIIFLLGFAVYWQFRTFQKSLSQVGEIQFPKFEMPNIEELLSSKNKEKKEFVSPDNKIKLKYSSTWIELDPETLEQMNKEAVKEEGEILFFAQKFKLEKAALAFLTVQEISKKEKSIEGFIETMKKETEEKGSKMEVIDLETKEGMASLEAKYQKEKSPPFHSKAKIFFTKDKIYLISIFSLEKDWQEFEKETDEILNSIQFTP